MYDFDKTINRRNTNSLKWNVKSNELPMWVADMDFETAPEIIEAIKTRVSHGVFGYNIIPDNWYEAYNYWWKKRHHWEIEKEWLMFSTGVVPIISSVVRKFSTPAENVLIQTPVYNIFFNSILNNGRNVIESPLLYSNGTYSIDFNDLEDKLSNPQTSLMILCNPHNPIGKIWDKDTLSRIGDLCAKYNVIVISDEIHCDLTAPNKEYIPFASVNDICKYNSITCIAPTKSFNIAGLQSAAVVVPNVNLRHKVYRALNNDEIAETNTFGVLAAVAAYTKGEAWLDELRVYLQENKDIVVEFLKKEIPELFVVSLDATYLLWVDCSKVCKETKTLVDHIRSETGLFITAGNEYGNSGKNFVRINIACNKVTLLDGLNRLKKGICSYENTFNKQD
ncbi:MAG: pyridoxal phosphate-dependent aminotransferase [Thomasclavelia sp.]|nr:pyridoxal phosphate-dependent aminotransferase [Thomasclavelia sp.]